MTTDKSANLIDAQAVANEQTTQAQALETELTEQKNKLLQLLEQLLRLIEKYRRPKAWEVMKDITKSLDNISVTNGATAAVLSDLIEITENLHDKVIDINPKEAQSMLDDCAQEIEILKSSLYGKALLDNVEHNDFEEAVKHHFVESDKLAFYKSADNLYICSEDEDSNIKKAVLIQHELVDEKIQFTLTPKSFSETMERICEPFTQENKDTAYLEAECILVATILTSDDKYMEIGKKLTSIVETNEEVKQKVNYRNALENTISFYADHKEKKFSESGKFVSFVDDNNNFCICDTASHQMVMLNQSREGVVGTIHKYDSDFMPIAGSGKQCLFLCNTLEDNANKDIKSLLKITIDENKAVTRIFNSNIGNEYLSKALNLNKDSINDIHNSVNKGIKGTQEATKGSSFLSEDKTKFTKGQNSKIADKSNLTGVEKTHNAKNEKTNTPEVEI